MKWERKRGLRGVNASLCSLASPRIVSLLQLTTHSSYHRVQCTISCTLPRNPQVSAASPAALVPVVLTCRLSTYLLLQLFRVNVMLGSPRVAMSSSHATQVHQ